MLLNISQGQDGLWRGYPARFYLDLYSWSKVSAEQCGAYMQQAVDMWLWQLRN